MLTALKQLAAELAAAGIPAKIDPRNLNTPGAYLKPRTLAHDVLGCLGTVTVDVFLVVKDNGAEQALTKLDALLELALDVLEPTEDTQLDAALNTPDQGVLPAYIVTTQIHPE